MIRTGKHIKSKPEFPRVDNLDAIVHFLDCYGYIDMDSTLGHTAKIWEFEDHIKRSKTDGYIIRQWGRTNGNNRIIFSNGEYTVELNCYRKDGILGKIYRFPTSEQLGAYEAGDFPEMREDIIRLMGF